MLAGLLSCKMVLLLLLGRRYDYHVDELYFIACGRHLSFGYVDHPPLVPWLARLSGALFNYDLLGLRLWGASAGALTLALTVFIVRRWNGGLYAQLLAGLAVLIAPVYLRAASILCIPAFEPLFWTLGGYLVVRLLQGAHPSWWLAVGAVAGVGLLNKHTMLLWGLGLALGLLLTPHRRHLRSPWLWGGTALALLIFLPNLIWQYRFGWPTLEFVQHIDRGMLAAIPRHLFLLGQVLYAHPVSLPVWLAGLAFFFGASGRRYQLFGWMYCTALAIFLIQRGKPYYLAPAYPLLFAGGGVLLEQLCARKTRVALLATMALGGIALGVFSLPVFPLPVADQWVGRMFGFVVRPQDLTSEMHEQYGWRELAAQVAEEYHKLSPIEQRNCTILTQRYSQASAINFFAPDLPAAVSGHMSYYLWGPGPLRGEVVISCGVSRSELENHFAEIVDVGRTFHPLAPQSENGLPILVCRKPRQALREMWPSFKHYYHRVPLDGR